MLALTKIWRKNPIFLSDYSTVFFIYETNPVLNAVQSLLQHFCPEIKQGASLLSVYSWLSRPWAWMSGKTFNQPSFTCLATTCLTFLCIITCQKIQLTWDFFSKPTLEGSLLDVNKSLRLNQCSNFESTTCWRPAAIIFENSFSFSKIEIAFASTYLKITCNKPKMH